jgi:hypothetical protein
MDQGANVATGMTLGRGGMQLTGQSDFPGGFGMYKIVRMYFRNRGSGNRVIARGLTLEEAQAHCSNPETSSRTATSAAAKQRTKTLGPWFDGYEECTK